ncbi:MAG: hypothetical protein NPINA01_04320 [Nitrospinaceae bacterium]|nr:MAG: hypothetical protein NPINA01_04320 [Nitrospinaceae bacterium]
MHRIRMAMSGGASQEDLLYGIVEADETYIGGKPRKKNNHNDDNNNKRGRGTNKTPVVGVIERGGRVHAEPFSKKKLNGKGLAKFIQKHVDTAASFLMTDEYKGYNKIKKTMRHGTVNHSYEYANGMIHTNSMEGFWALVKRAFYGQHHNYSKKYTALYIAEACYKYNNRKKKSSFSEMIGLMVAV